MDKAYSLTDEITQAAPWSKSAQNNSDINKVDLYCNKYLDIKGKKCRIITIDDLKSIDEYATGESVLEKADSVKCLERINDIRYINKFFESINKELPIGGLFIGCVETISGRNNRKRISKVPYIGKMYFGVEFLFNRAFPKIYGLKKIYFFVTRGKNRILSKAETLGRLVSCGFSIENMRTIDGLLYFVVKKEKEPHYNMQPSYGLLYKMPRIGKNGKMIGVYKLRTMHPYAEYLQNYVVNRSGYDHETGKPANDFRLTPWGRVLRKYWLDELPQLINVLNGSMKLVGARPVTERYFQDIPEHLQKLRIKQKPGCIPPYVALNKNANVDDVLEAERIYMEEKLKKPYSTDIKYFFKSIFTIIVKGKRSA